MAIRVLVSSHLMMGLAFLWGSCCGGSNTFHAASTIDGLTTLLQGNPDCCDEDGHTMLGKAAAEDCLEALNFLLVRGAQPDVPSGGLTPLMWASRNGHTEAMKQLLHAGARVDVHDGQGRTALMMASEQRRIEAVRMLLEARAKPNFCRSNWTPLMCAASGGSATVLKMLLQAGAEVNAVTQRGRSALLCAIQAEHISFAEALLAAGAEPDRLDMDSGTPLISAASSGILGAVRLLLHARANANFARADGSSALLLAAKEGNVCIAKELLAAGANPNNSNNEGDVPLISALKRQHTEVVKLLLEMGADVDIFDASGWTPLTWAVHYRMVKPVEWLLEAGADPNLSHSQGLSPLGYVYNYSESHRQAACNLFLALAKYGARLYEEKYGRNRDSTIAQSVFSRGSSALCKRLLDIVRARRYGVQKMRYWDRKSQVAMSNPRNLDEWVDLFEAGIYKKKHMLIYAIFRGWADGIYLALKYGADLNDHVSRHIDYGIAENCKAYNQFIRYSRTPVMYALHQGWWKMAKVLIDFGASSAYQVSCLHRPEGLRCVIRFVFDSPHDCFESMGCRGPNSFERAAYTFDAVDDAVALALQEYNDQHRFSGMWWQVPKPGRGFEILRFLAVHNLLTPEQRKRLCSLADRNTEKGILCRIGPRVICDSRGRYSDWTMDDVQRYTTWLFAGISERLEHWYKERYTPLKKVLPRDLVNVVRKFDAVDCIYG